MKVMTVHTIKLDKKYIAAQEVIEIKDKKILKRLMEKGAVTSMETAPKRKMKAILPSREDSIKALMSIKSVNKKTADILYKAKLTSVNDVAEQSVKDLEKVKGISPELAKQIHDCFE